MIPRLPKGRKTQIQKHKINREKKFFIARGKANTWQFLERNSIHLLKDKENCYIITDGIIKLIEIIEFFMHGKKGVEIYKVSSPV